MKLSLIFLTVMLCMSCGQDQLQQTGSDTDDLMLRWAEIRIEPEDLDKYLSILREEAKASMELEPGVISIFPMYQTEHPGEIRILEIYADRQAYESHLETPHFKHYKTATSGMVKSLELIDMESVDVASMPLIFSKTN